MQKITVIVSSYNHSNFISETINSLKYQSYRDFEVIIIDDCSSDNSVEIIKNCICDDNRFRLIQNEKNLGLAKTIEKAIKYASNDWIAFCESDDLWGKNHLKTLVANIDKYGKRNFIFVNKTRIIYNKSASNYNNIYKIYIFKANLLQANKFLCNSCKKPNNISYRMKKCNAFPTFSSVAIKKDLLLNLNFNPPIDRSLDWWLWGQATYKHKCLYVNNCYTYWRIHQNSYTSTTNISKEENKHFKKCLINLLKETDMYYYYTEILKRFIFNIKRDDRGDVLISIFDLFKIKIAQKKIHISIAIPKPVILKKK